MSSTNSGPMKEQEQTKKSPELFTTPLEEKKTSKKKADNRPFEHVFGVNPLSEEAKVGVFRFLFEKRFKALSITNLLALLAVLILL